MTHKVCPTVGDRAMLFGIAYRDQLELEREQPWCKHWSARYGEGAARMRQWLAAGRPSADRSMLTVKGDPPIVDAVRAVVASLPEAVACFVVANVVVFGSGITSSGWCGAAPRPPCDSPLQVNLATADQGVISHELAHAWHLYILPSSCRLTAVEMERIRTATLEQVIDDEQGKSDFLDETFEHEKAADALATQWGYPIDSMSGHHRDLRRKLIERDLALVASRRTATAKGDRR